MKVFSYRGCYSGSRGLLIIFVINFFSNGFNLLTKSLFVCLFVTMWKFKKKKTCLIQLEQQNIKKTFRLFVTLIILKGAKNMLCNHRVNNIKSRFQIIIIIITDLKNFFFFFCRRMEANWSYR